jgi:hypothetical protein
MTRTTLQSRIYSGARRGLLGTRPVLPGFRISQTTAVLGPEGELRREYVQQKPELGEEFSVPDGHRLKGVSALVGASGHVIQQWLKTDLDRLRQEEITRETIAALVADITRADPTTPPENISDDLCVAYCIGDAHLGLYSWGEETGANFDLDIAKRDLMLAVDRLIAAVPPSGECLVVQLGDFYHMDDSRNVTPKSGNRLDVDSRFAKVIRVGITLMRYTIDRALERHGKVRVRNVAGNHDPHANITLTEALKGYYLNEPRVIIEDSPRPFWVYRFGSCLVGITHGDGVKTEDMPGVLAVDAQADWGQCEFRYCWHGHIHSKKVIEKLGVIVESFRTLAGKDAWHTEQGYRPGREMQAIVLHKKFGEIERHTAGLRRIRSTSGGGVHGA